MNKVLRWRYPDTERCGVRYDLVLLSLENYQTAVKGSIWERRAHKTHRVEINITMKRRVNLIEVGFFVVKCTTQRTLTAIFEGH